MMQGLDELDKKIIALTESGLPLEVKPFQALAEQMGVREDEVLTRMRKMISLGMIRRIAAVPDHYRLGITANGMSVWNIPDDKVSELGPQVGALSFVSHCYERPRHLPLWPYNLFAMVHAPTREEVLQNVEKISKILYPHLISYDVLFSKRILKKTGFRSQKKDK